MHIAGERQHGIPHGVNIYSHECRGVAEDTNDDAVTRPRRARLCERAPRGECGRDDRSDDAA